MQPTVLITGGARGIGAETVRLFYYKGYRVAFCDRNSEDAAQALAAQLPGVLAIKADLVSPDDITVMAHQVLFAFGHLDVLVLNAGTALQKLLPDTTCEEWDMLFNINLRAMFLCCRAFLPGMNFHPVGSSKIRRMNWSLRPILVRQDKAKSL